MKLCVILKVRHVTEDTMCIIVKTLDYGQSLDTEWCYKDKQIYHLRYMTYFGNCAVVVCPKIVLS